VSPLYSFAAMFREVLDARSRALVFGLHCIPEESRFSGTGLGVSPRRNRFRDLDVCALLSAA